MRAGGGTGAAGVAAIASVVAVELAVLAANIAEQVIAQIQGRDGGHRAHLYRGVGQAVEAIVGKVFHLVGAKILALGEVAQQVMVVGEVLERGSGRRRDAGEPAAQGVEVTAEGGGTAQFFGDLASGIERIDLLVDLRGCGRVAQAIGVAAHVPGVLHGAAAGVGVAVKAAQ